MMGVNVTPTLASWRTRRGAKGSTNRSHLSGTAALRPHRQRTTTHPRHRRCGPARARGRQQHTTAHSHGGAATTRHRTTQPPCAPCCTPCCRSVLSVGRWRRARPRARVGRQGDQPGRPSAPATGHPASPPGTQQLDRRVPCINMQSNGETAQLGHRFGFWNATMLLTARSSLASPPSTSQTGQN